MDRQVKHSIKRIYGGKNETSWIQLNCSCGWSSRKVQAYEDYQLTILNAFQREHQRKGE